MNSGRQASFSCRCGKRHPLPATGESAKKCGCGRTIYLKDGRVQSIEDKKRNGR